MSITWICSKCGKYQGNGPFYMTSGLVCDKCEGKEEDDKTGMMEYDSE